MIGRRKIFGSDEFVHMRYNVYYYSRASVVALIRVKTVRIHIVSVRLIKYKIWVLRYIGGNFDVRRRHLAFKCEIVIVSPSI